MPGEVPNIKVFISSPSDVRPERLIAARVVERLDREFMHHCRIEPVLWERKPLKATLHFQHPDNIPAPHTTDIVVVILWSRLGVTLPTDFLGAKTGRPVTGTEWEFEDALKASEDLGVPDLLVYRKTAPTLATVGGEAEERNRQKRLVDDFVARWFVNASDGTFRAASHSFADPVEFEETIYTHLRAKILEQLGNPAGLHTVRWQKGSPFRGLESFGPEHAQVFFGRRRARNELREALAAQVEAGRRMLLVMGASGSGKSSLVKAGLLPDLLMPGMLADVGLVRWAVMRPGDHGGDPMRALAIALREETALPALPFLATAAPDALAGSVAEALAACADAQELAPPWQPLLVLVIDQLEELFAEAVSRDSRATFAAAIEALALKGGAVVIATLRSDFFPVLEEMPGLAALTVGAGRVLLLPPDDGEIGEIILAPAQEAGLDFEPHPDDGRPLNETLRQDAAAEPGVLPLLEFTLEQLWHQRDGNQLTHAAYRDLGGLKGAIGHRAEAIVAAQLSDIQAALPRLLFALARAEQSEGGRILARAVPLSAFIDGSPERRLAQALLATDARLLVADEGGTLRVAHEALLTHWPQARDIVATTLADLVLRARLEQAEELWRRAAAPDQESLLLRSGLPLSEGEDLLKRRRVELDGRIVAFIETSSAVARAAERRRLRRLRTVAGIFALLAALATGFGWWGWDRSVAADLNAEKANRSAEEAKRRLAAAQRNESMFLGTKAAELARNPVRPDVGRAALLADAGLPRDFDHPDRPLIAEPLSALAQAANADTSIGLFKGHTSMVVSAAYSLDGGQVVTASLDGTARVWDADSGAERMVLRHTATVHSAAFSPDASRVVTTSSMLAGAVGAQIWDARSGVQLVALKGHTQEVTSAAFSPDGRRVVTASSDHTARVWDADSGAPLAVLGGHTGKLLSAAFSPDGQRLVTTSADKTVRVWDAANGDERAVLATDEVFSAVFRSDGRHVWVVGADKVSLWDTDSGATRESAIRGDRIAAFSADGRWLMTAGNSIDYELELWDIKDEDVPQGDPLRRIAVTGHLGNVLSIAVSPNGRKLVTTGETISGSDNAVRQWWATPPEVGEVTVSMLAEQPDDARSGALSPNGDRLATTSFDADVHVWDMDGGVELTVLKGHANEVTSMSFSQDGRRILTASLDETARVWDAVSGAELAVLKGHVARVTSAAFSLDGSRVVTASMDASARVWDAASGAELAVLGGNASLDMQDWPESAAFSPDGRLVVTASMNKIARVWDATSGAELAVLKGHAASISSAKFSSDGRRVVTVSNDNTARLWDAASGAELAVFKDQSGVSTMALAEFSPDGRRLVTVASDRNIAVHDAASGVQLAALKPQPGHIGAVSASFSQDGRRLVVIGSSDAVLWDMVTGAELAEMPKVVAGKRLSAVFSRDGRRVSVGAANAAILWDVTRLLPGVLPYYQRAGFLQRLQAEERDTLFAVRDNAADAGLPAGISACDALAADPLDPARLGPARSDVAGVTIGHIDANQAIPACRQAMDTGDTSFRYRFQLARALLKGGQTEHAFGHAMAACDGAYAAACGLAADMLRDGADLTRNPARAVELYRRAVDLGNMAAASGLAAVLWDGADGVAADRQEALALWSKAADRGIPHAHAALAQRYEHGGDLPKDLQKALFHRAVAANLFEAGGFEQEADAQTAQRGALARAMDPIMVARIWRDQVMTWKVAK